METLRTQLEVVIKSIGTSQSEAAKAMGISSPTLSDWRHNKYKGDNARIEALVLDYINRQGAAEREAKAQKSDFDFIETSVYEEIKKGANLAESRGEIRVVVGDSGVGKTKALYALRAAKPSSILVQVYRGMRKNRFLQKLCKAAGVDARGSFDDLFEALCEELDGTGRLIKVDEAEHLPLDALDALRRLNDFTGCGVLLVGLPVFYTQLRNCQREFAYIHNRTSLPIILGHLTPEDTTALVTTILPDIQLSGIWHTAAAGIGRDLKIIVFESLRVAELNHIDPTDGTAMAVIIRKITKELGRAV